MKITIDHQEFLALQNARKGITRYVLSSNEMRVLSRLFEHGLIQAAAHLYRHSAEYTELWPPINITRVGMKVLQEHSPWMEEDNAHDKIRLERLQVTTDSQLYLIEHETSRT